MERLEALWKYQQVDMKATAVEVKLKNSETRKKLMKARNYLMESQQNLKKMEAEAEELRVALETVQHKTESYRDRIDQLSMDIQRLEDTATMNDVDRMRKEIADTRDQLSKQEYTVTSILDSVARIDDAMKRLFSGIPKAKADFEQLKKIYDNDAVEATKQIEPFRQEMRKMEKELDPQLLARYQAIKKTRVNPIAMVLNGQCMGCNMELPSIVQKKISYDSAEIVECDNCGRMLFVKKPE